VRLRSPAAPQNVRDSTRSQQTSRVRRVVIARFEEPIVRGNHAHGVCYAFATPLRPVLALVCLCLSNFLTRQHGRSALPFAAMSLALVLSPGGHLHVEPDEKAELELKPGIATQLGEVFGSSSPRGLELLGGSLLHEALPATFVFWRGLAQRGGRFVCLSQPLNSYSATRHKQLAPFSRSPGPMSSR
jgi:hypothetical protein